MKALDGSSGGFLSEYLGDWAQSVDCTDVPALVRDIARAAILDTAAVGVAGTQTRVGQLAHSLAPIDPAPAISKTWTGTVLPASSAAYVNAACCHALDMDDTCFSGIIHGSSVILAVVLAAAQADNKSGSDVLDAFIVGSEIAYVLGATVGSELYDRGFWPTGVFAGIGAVAGLARLSALSSAETAQAIAFAGCLSNPYRTVIGSDAKPLILGETAYGAFRALALAQSNASAPMDLFERDDGPLAVLIGDQYSPNNARRLGQTWSLKTPGLVIKSYPLCSSAQSAVGALKEILDQHEISVGNVTSIAVSTTQMVVDILRYRVPETETEAMFSLPYALACMLIDNSVDPAHISEESIQRPDVAAAIDKISVSVDSERFQIAENPEAAHVVVKRNDGVVFEATCLHALGDPRNPLSHAEFEKKIAVCLRHLSPENQKAFKHFYKNLDLQKNVSLFG